MMKTDTQLIVYLDTSIFLAWLKDEERPDYEMEGVYECFERTKKDEIKAIVSSIILTEVDIGRYPADKQAEYYELFSMRNPEVTAADSRVCKLAGELRSFFLKERKKSGCGKLETADAIHLATAIHYEAHEFYAFDDKLENMRTRMLALSGTIAGYGSLVIRKPPATTPRLPLKDRGGDNGKE